MKPDVVVIGGGPAGSAAAIRLARTGRRVRLYEKAHFPRAKLCGGFLSPESLEDIDDLGILPELEQNDVLHLRRSVVISQKNTRIETALSRPALSVTRDSFDHVLLQQAAKEGVEVIFGEDGFPHAKESPITVVAAGRLHRGSRSLKPTRLSPWYAGSGIRYVGLQALFENVRDVTDQVELDIVSQGYVGLAQQKEGVNVCALTTESMIQRYGPDLDQVLKEFMKENPALREHLQSARRVRPWMSVGPVRLGIRRLVEEKTFYIGDAACVVDPFAGEGMAMGLYASRLLMKALTEPKGSQADTYTRLWRQAYLPALRWNAVMRSLYGVPFLREPSMKILQAFPQGMTLLTDLTRYRFVTP